MTYRYSTQPPQFLLLFKLLLPLSTHAHPSTSPAPAAPLPFASASNISFSRVHFLKDRLNWTIVSLLDSHFFDPLSNLPCGIRTSSTSAKQYFCTREVKLWPRWSLLSTIACASVSVWPTRLSRVSTWHALGCLHQWTGPDIVGIFLMKLISLRITCRYSANIGQFGIFWLRKAILICGNNDSILRIMFSS